jgi:hypothetical protein
MERIPRTLWARTGRRLVKDSSKNRQGKTSHPSVARFNLNAPSGRPRLSLKRQAPQESPRGRLWPRGHRSLGLTPRLHSSFDAFKFSAEIVRAFALSLTAGRTP